MTIFDVLALIGGLCLFLFGMNVMGDSLERRAGGGLKLLLGKLTGNKFKAFLTGLGVTAVIQSSSATTVVVVGVGYLRRADLSTRGPGRTHLRCTSCSAKGIAG